MSATPPISPLDIQELAQRALKAVEDLPPEQQQAVLQAATAIAQAAVDLRQRLFLAGTLVHNLTRR
jgi:hypothetical protein